MKECSVQGERRKKEQEKTVTGQLGPKAKGVVT
jgi:hypothetical protein